MKPLRTRRPRLAVGAAVVLLLASWAALAAWQWDEYGHERRMAEESLRRQAETIKTALVGGIRSHPRLGPFFEELLQAVLDELAGARDVLAVGIASYVEPPRARQILLYAGDRGLLEATSARPDRVYRFEDTFRLESDTVGAHGAGRGGGGWGRGKGGPWEEESGRESAFQPGRRFDVILILDQTSMETQVRRAFWLRVWVVAAGGMVLVCIGLGWLATLRLVATRGRAHLLELETSHLRDLGQAAAGLAHETRNPLGLVRGWAQRLAESDIPSAEQHRQARAVVEECDRITARINQFLAFAKPCQPQLEPVDPRILLKELTVLLEPDLEAKGLRLKDVSAAAGVRIQADREMFCQTLFNLISNAIHFSPEQGTVEVAVLAGQDGHYRMEVSDRGPGVAADKVGSLFTPYFTTRPGGTGLGLAIVRRIAAAHGWEAGYASRPGGGAVFWLDRIYG